MSDLLSVLKNAQVAHTAGDFVNALKFYQSFFCRARTEEPEAHYSVRLSYCLDGWSRLAAEFPGALNSLREEQLNCLALYQATREPEMFHDYLQISKRLDESQAALSVFIDYHSADSKAAAKLSKYVWEDLITAECWEVCNALLIQPSLKLDELFAIFDESNQLKIVNSAFDSHEFEQHTLEQLTQGLSAVIEVLRRSNRADEIENLKHLFQQGVNTRNHPALTKHVSTQGGRLFSND